MTAILTIVFVGLLGVTIVIPLFPFFAERVGADPGVVTLLMAVYAAGQFIGAPVWGRISDRVGRKPVFVISMIGSVVAYLILGFAETLEWLLVSRALGGLMAGNVAVAYAAMSDLTSSQGRARGMGMVGGAFNLGFIAGPALGGLIAGNDLDQANFLLVALVAAGMAAVALVLTLLFLEETLPPERRNAASAARAPGEGLRAALKRVRGQPLMLILLALTFVYVSSASMLDTTFALYVNKALGHGPAEIGLLFSYLGIIGAAVQFTVIGLLSRKLGDASIALLGMLGFGLGLVLLIAADGLPEVVLATTFLACGNSLFIPTISSLVSRVASESDRGLFLGLHNAAGNLGRIITPLGSGLLFAKVGQTAPFTAGILLLMPAIVLVLLVARSAPGRVQT